MLALSETSGNISTDTASSVCPWRFRIQSRWRWRFPGTHKGGLCVTTVPKGTAASNPGFWPRHECCPSSSFPCLLRICNSCLTNCIAQFTQPCLTFWKDGLYYIYIFKVHFPWLMRALCLAIEMSQRAVTPLCFSYLCTIATCGSIQLCFPNNASKWDPYTATLPFTQGTRVKASSFVGCPPDKYLIGKSTGLKVRAEVLLVSSLHLCPLSAPFQQTQPSLASRSLDNLTR